MPYTFIIDIIVNYNKTITTIISTRALVQTMYTVQCEKKSTHITVINKYIWSRFRMVYSKLTTFFFYLYCVLEAFYKVEYN